MILRRAFRRSLLAAPVPTVITAGESAVLGNMKSRPDEIAAIRKRLGTGTPAKAEVA